MKRILLAFCLSFVCYFGYAQSYWSKGYALQDAFSGFYDFDMAFNEVDDQIIIAGLYQDSTGYNRMVVTALDTSGEVNWSKTSITPIFTNQIELSLDPITGEIFILRSRLTNAFLTKLTPSGAHLWGDQIIFTENRSSSHLQLLDNKSLVVVSNPSNSTGKVYVINISSSGNLISSHAYETFSGTGTKTSFSDAHFIETPKQNYLIGQGQLKTKVVLLDKDFNISAVNEFSSPNHQVIIPNALMATPNGVIMASTFQGIDGEGVVNIDTSGMPVSLYNYSSNFSTGFAFVKGNPVSKPLAISSSNELYRINSLGGLDFKVYPNVAPLNTNSSTGLAFKGGYAFVAINALNAGYHFGIQYFKENGMLPCQAAYVSQGANLSTQFSVNSITATRSSINLAITTENPGLSGLTILAEPSCLDERLSLSEGDKITPVYPNPTSGIIHIDSRGGFNKLEVFNTLGQQVETMNINGTSINLEHLPVGVYVLRFQGSDNVHVTRLEKQ